MTDQTDAAAEDKRASVYTDAAESEANGDHHKPIDDTENPRPASPTDNLALPVDASKAGESNGDTHRATSERSNAEDPYSVLIATLRLQNGDLHSQVNMLNTKLVSSYGRYGDLEEHHDRIKQELAQMQKTNESLLQERQSWEQRVEGGALVEKAHVQDELTRMMDRVLEETAQRGKAETDKATIEKELDELSASLFGEANKMVASERQARAIADAKSRSLEDRLRDTEGLISHQADQMRQLGSVIEAIERERDEIRAKLTSFEQDPAFIAARDALPLSSEGEPSQPPSPRLGGSFPHLSSRLPELLTDILPYHEFHIFIRHLHRLRINTLSRPYEPSAGNAAAMTLGLGGSAPPSPDPQSRLNEQLPLSQHLSQPFIKRCQEEDSDPTLRLDLAPGLSWLNRRSVGQAIVDGHLIIEPAYGVLPPTEKCALCGMSLERWLVDPTSEGASAAAMPAVTGGQAAVRRLMGTQTWASQGWAKWGAKANATSQQPSAPASPNQASPIHVFRTTSDTASSGTRHALCPEYCLTRLRAVCDLWTAIRNIERSLLLGDRAPTPGLTSALKTETSRKSLGIGSVSNLLRRTASSEPRSPTIGSPTIADVPTMPQIEEPPQPIEQVESAPVAEAIDEVSKDVAEESVDAKEGEVTTETPERVASPAPAPTDDHLAVQSAAKSAPPLPKRSVARTPSPAPPSGLAPAAQITPAPIRQRMPSGGFKSFDSSSSTGSWEEKAWQDLVKLKEALFWSRIGIVMPEVKT